MSRRPNEQVVVVFGEVLADRFPDGSEALGGASFNVAWNLKGLGAEPYLVSRVGDDPLGSRILEAMAGWEMETGGVQLDGRHPTGVVQVAFDGGEPAFDIVPGSAWDFIAAAETAPPEAPVLYHGSLACRSRPAGAALRSLIQRRPDGIFFDVNLRPPWWERRRIGELLATACEVKLNEGELEVLVPEGADVGDRAARLLARSGAERLHVTRGAQGALSLVAGGKALEVTPERATRVADTVGAGDAFSAVLILGRLRSWPLASTLARARDFAAAVVGLRGATVDDRAFYDRFAAQWRDS